MSYPTTGQEVYVSLNLSNTMLTGIGKGTITREEVSASYLKRLFAEHGVIVSAKPEQARLLAQEGVPFRDENHVDIKRCRYSGA